MDFFPKEFQQSWLNPWANFLLPKWKSAQSGARIGCRKLHSLLMSKLWESFAYFCARTGDERALDRRLNYSIISLCCEGNLEQNLSLCLHGGLTWRAIKTEKMCLSYNNKFFFGKICNRLLILFWKMLSSNHTLSHIWRKKSFLIEIGFPQSLRCSLKNSILPLKWS